MTRRSERIATVEAAAWPLAAFALYVTCLPRTVQGLDTGELVGHAARLRLIHPPGYPLYQWLTHAWCALPFDTVFHGAAFATALHALAALGLLASVLPRVPGLATAVLVPLATAPPFWEYAVLPDVFMLHLLLVSSALWLHVRVEDPARRLLPLSVVMALGAAHHHSLVFLSPLWFAALLGARSWPRRVAAVALGGTIVVALYASLFLVDSTSLAAWRELRSASDLVGHFLRRDYGTGSLVSGGGSNDLAWAFRLVVTELSPANPTFAVGLLAASALVAHEARGGVRAALSSPVALPTLCALAYLGIFFALANLRESPQLEPMFLRHLLMPLVLGTWLAALVARHAAARLPARAAVALGAVALAFGAGNVARAHATLDYASNAAIEDVAVGLLRSAPTERPVVLLGATDTLVGALGYAQDVLGVRRDVAVAPLGRLFRRDRFARLQAEVPGLVVDPAVFDAEQRGVARYLFRPNAGKVDFMLLEGARFAGLRTVQRPLGVVVTVGEGDDLDLTGEADLPNRTPPAKMAAFHRYDESQALHAHRCRRHLVRAARTPDPLARLPMLDAALAEVPYCLPALEQRCRLVPAPDQPTCWSRYEDVRADTFDYWP